MSKRSLDALAHSQDLVEAALRMDRAIGVDGLPHASGRGVVHDVMRTVDLLQLVADDLKDTAVTWVDAEQLREEHYIAACQHLDEMIHGLRAAFISAQAAYHALGSDQQNSVDNAGVPPIETQLRSMLP